MGVIDERTPLRNAEGGEPPYMYMTNPNRLYRKQIHQFQCLICLSFLLLFSTALVLSFLQAVEDDTIDNDNNNTNDGNNLNSSSIEPLLNLSWPIPDKAVGEWNGGEINEQVIQEALSAAQISLAAKDKIEQNMVGLPPDTPSYKHQRSIKTSLRATYLARSGYMSDVATRSVLKSSGLSEKFNKTSIGRYSSLKNFVLGDYICGEKPKQLCMASQYRTVDGTCNNLNNPETWGVAMLPFRRALPPDYGDGVSEPRKAVDGSELPSARNVSITVHRPEYRGDDQFTVMLAVWGQFLDHDITATALSQGQNGGTISCCGKLPSELHPECYPVKVGPDDPYFKNITCLEFVRSASAPTCSLGPREQLNQASSYIDGSVVYGNTDEIMSSLRSYEGGQLRMTITSDGRALLPISTDPKDGCNTEEENSKGRYCFASGDARANENVHLTTMHLIMARQHNFIATQLSAINPDWNDEILFQESRKIVAAQMQHITYNEFLPVLLGDELMDKLDLKSQTNGYYEKYDPAVDATVSNNFATASFRFAHTLLPGLMKIMKNMSDDEQVELHKLLFDPYKLYSPGYLDSAVSGAMNTPLERLDNYFNKELTEKLFKQPSKPCGLDLVSLNIQRGRDHGLKSYPAWREHCGLSKPFTFDDLHGYVDEDSLTRMSSLYKSVDDIDLYTGALSEYPSKGGMLGPTLTCLIGDQFKRLKSGDRYWYETSEQPQAFSSAQLDEIRKTSLARIICDTADAVSSIRTKVMQSLAPNNQQVPCQQISQPDLAAWSKAFSSNLKTSIPTQTGILPISARMGLYVTQVSISPDDGSMWTDKPPINIPMNLFKSSSILPTHSLPPSVQWTISTVAVSPLKVSVSGSYSSVTYIFGPPGFFNYSIKQSTGKFSFDADIVWNDTDISAVIQDNSAFSSSLFFSPRAPKILTFNKFDKPLKFDNSKESIIQSYGITEKSPQSSIILTGNYSLDKTQFYWSGNLTLTLPFVNNLLNTVNGKENLQAAKPSDNSKFNKTRAIFFVSNGSIVEDFDDGSQKILWNGDLPASFPLLSASGVPLATPFSAIFTITEGSPNIKGTFSLPDFSHRLGFNISWTNGKFNFMSNGFLNTSLDSIIRPGFKYSAKIFLSASKSVLLDYDSISWNDLSSSNEENEVEALLSESLDEVDGVIPVTIVLKGSYSPDKTVFKWFGEGIIDVENVSKFTENIQKQKILLEGPVVTDPLLAKSRFGGTVTRGHVAVKSNGLFNFENTVWSGTFPVAIPVSYLSGNFSSYAFTLGINWSGDLLGSIIEGQFSLPQFTGDWYPYPSVQMIDGSFSFDIQPLWNITLEELIMPGAKYFSKISLQGIKVPIANDILLASAVNPTGDQDISTTIYAPIVLAGTYSPDKTIFYWSGSFIITFNSGFAALGSLKLLNNGKSIVKESNISTQPMATGYKLESKVVPSKSKILGAKVNSGVVNIHVGNETQVLWSGGLPVNIPVSLIQTLKLNNYCIPWSGSLTGSIFKGSFSFPSISKNESEIVINWLSGDFELNVLPLWFTSLNAAIIPGRQYCSNINFQGNSTSSNKSELTVPPVNANLSLAAAVILKGNYSLDESVFFWNGQLIISFKNASALEFNLKSPFKNDDGGFPSKLEKDAKEPKAPKPPKGPKIKKSSVSLTVTSGNVIAGLDALNMTQLWNGILPWQITLDNIIDANGFTPSAHVTWSGTPTTTSLVGKFSFPVNEVFNDTVTLTKNWIGNFSVNFVVKWSGDIESLVVPDRSYNCRILFDEFSPKKSAPLLSTGNELVQASGDETNDCNIITVGTFYKKPFYCPILPFLCSDDTIFTWNGEIILTFTSPPPVAPIPAQTQLKKFVNGFGIQRKIIGKVLSGSLTAGLVGQNQNELWSGIIPASIPLPVFWAPVTDSSSTSEDEKVYGHGAIWSGSVFGSTVHGKFSLPQYTWNGAVSSIRWWNGDFSVEVMSLWDTGIGSLVTPGLQFYSRVIFRDVKDTTNLLQSFPPSQDDVDNAYKAPLILLGTFSVDRKIFYWSGSFIIVFYDVPDANVFSY